MKIFINRALFRLKNDSFINCIKLLFKFIFSKSNKIDLDKLKLQNDLTLNEIFLTFGTDKGKLDGKKTFYKLTKNLDNKHLFMNYKDWILRKNIQNYNYELGLDYVSVYEKFFKKIKNDKLNILEIGVAGGHSHASWYKYFINSDIYGIDIRPKENLLYIGKRLHYFQLNCTSPKEIEKFKSNNKIQFDIIIDDSLHDYEGFIGNIINFFSMVKPGGHYFLEDFKRKDERLTNMRNYNEKYGKLLMGYYLTMKEIFQKLSNKETFEYSYFSKDQQERLHQNIEKIDLFYPEHPSASLAVIKKK